MRFLLIALVLFLTASAVFNFDPGPLPGIKIKNGLLYLIMMVLMLRVTLDRSYRIQLPAVPILFMTLIGYALLTYVAIVLAIDYSRYNTLQAGFILKNTLFDQMLLFLVFFYGLRTNEDALTVLKVLLTAWALSHIMAVLDATGMVHLGDIELRGDGRVQGAIGESNQYGAFVALTLPTIIAMVTITRGAWRIFWIGASVVTGAALIMTVSRGAFVATAVAIVYGVWLFRRFMPARKLVIWAVCGLVGAVIVGTVVLSLGYGELLYQRVVNHGVGADITETSSGRTEIWLTVLGVMFHTPLTLLTGFGWEAYPTFPFRWVTHNHYLQLFFNLGLVGVITGVLLLVIPIRTMNAAATYARPDVRAVLISFGMGTIALATAVFFVNLYSPWLYYWAYAGIVMRLAANALEPQAAYAPAAVAAPAASRASRARDPHGWTAAQ